jgi:hypothetical protein
VAYLLKQYFWQLEEARTRDPLEQAGAREDEETEPAPERAPRARRERSGDREDGRKRKKKGKDKDRDRSEPAEPSLQDGVRLFVNRGSIDGYDERRLRTLVAQASGLQEGIGRIQLRRTHSFVEVSPEVMEAAVAAANAGLEREDKPVNMEPARTRG